MTFKPGFHKAAMEYVRWIIDNPGDHSDKAWSDTCEEMRDKVRDEIADFSPESMTARDENALKLEGAMDYLAHTELHGWEE